ncbi:Indigoidine synthase A like protein-domain-containing protein [Lipomyces oligophaga]|uniref:Indigoidine synthase A like protein-domain-containing protein n=1 Tax=Lipomyces oligophaga TaxID=45792 RepID=UPI0034D00B2B
MIKTAITSRPALLAKPRLGLFRRHISVPSQLSIDPEVADAIASKKPVLALESTILTHGIPYPHNLTLANDLNKIIRKEGVVPATIALIDGRPVVGASDAELEVLCTPPPEGKKFIKVSRRDIAYSVAHGVTGGTTIAGTMILAHAAGIRVFATGGLGGVHRGVEHTLDISADLEELGRTPVAVVSAGAKAILDLAKTFEYLETKGVHVSTYGPKGTNIPAFYSRDSGIPSPFNFTSPEDAAAVIHANNLLQLESGMLFCIPPPHEHAIPSEEIDEAINEAVIAANEARVSGKDITPFLLDRILTLTDGRSLQSNVGFVKNNILVGARIASALSKIGSSEASPNKNVQPAPVSPSVFETTRPTAVVSAPADALVIGAVAVDLTCDLTHATLEAPKSYMHTSNPGIIHRTPGGVGFNVGLAATYASSAYVAKGEDISIRMVSAVGPDARDLHASLGLQDDLEGPNPDMSGVEVVNTARTAQYVAMHDLKGDLIFACADMALVEGLPVAHITGQYERCLAEERVPSWVTVDANLDPEPFTAALAGARKIIGANTLVEPTSVIKACTLLDLGPEVLGVFPSQHAVDVMTPNEFELAALFSHAKKKGLFDDRADWWQVISSLGLNADFRDRVARLAQAAGVYEELVDQGLVQQAVHLSPFVPCLLVKLGRKGVVSVVLSSAEAVVAADSSQASKFSFTWQGSQLDGLSGPVALTVTYHAPETVSPADVVSVTGAGDSFAGVVLTELVRRSKAASSASSSSSSSSLSAGQSILADGPQLNQIVRRAQRAAVLTIQNRAAVSPAIRTLA